jgi:signal transduction histidine kinase
MTGWRRALFFIVGAQLLFWGFYLVIVEGLRPAETLAAYRLPAASALSRTEPGLVGAYVSGLSRPALLRISGWQPVVMQPARASVLTRAETKEGRDTWSIACLAAACATAPQAYVGPLVRMNEAAGWERFQRFDLVWLAIAVAVVLGAALLVLLPVNRYSRLQTITGLFLVLVGADAWFTAFGADFFPYTWFPLLRYSVEYLMLTAVALAVNAFAGWRPNEARIAGICCVIALAALVAGMLSGVHLSRVVPWLDAAAVVLLFGYGLVAMLRLGRTAPGPAIRVLSLLLVGIASIVFDIFLYPASVSTSLQATVLAPPLTMFGILFEIALQGSRLNQEAEEARSDLERQVLEQDASLLRSSQLLRHQERLIAVDAERQRLLRDMHDGVGGALTHLLLDVRGNRLNHGEIEQGLQSAVDDLRNMASAIDAGNEPIDEALAMFRERMAGRLARSGIAFEYRCTLPSPVPSLDVRRLLSLYRLLQEGIANSLRHAAATRIELTVEAGEGHSILVLLADNGVGFEPGSASGSPGEGRGLINMRRRADQIGGWIRVQSAPGQGTRLTMFIPKRIMMERKS